jgi:hypothetical protein
MVGGSLLLALGCAIAWASLAGAGFTVLMLGLFAAGAGIALPFASSPQIGLAALPQTQAGQGSGMLNAFSFLGGTVGVTCGGIIWPCRLHQCAPAGRALRARRRGALSAAARGVKSRSLEYVQPERNMGRSQETEIYAR